MPDTISDPSTQATVRTKKASLINKTEVRKLTLDLIQRGRPGFKRVGEDWFQGIEAEVRCLIAAKVHQHPSVGQTVKWQK